MLQRRAKVVNYNCQSVMGSCLSASQLQPALTCPINPPCPEGCSCKGSVMHCSRLGLILPPSPVPLLTTELHLSHNSITLSINTTMEQSLVRLTLLDLSYNAIEQLGPDSLPHLPNLKSLLLNNNRIQCITSSSQWSNTLLCTSQHFGLHWQPKGSHTSKVRPLLLLPVSTWWSLLERFKPIQAWRSDHLPVQLPLHWIQVRGEKG